LRWFLAGCDEKGAIANKAIAPSNQQLVDGIVLSQVDKKSLLRYSPTRK